MVPNKHQINGARPHFVKWGLAPFICGTIYLAPFIPKASLSSPAKSNHARSAFLTVFHHTAIAKQGTRQNRASSMSERSELGRRREERMENGVKNLKGARLFPKAFANNGNGDACSFLK
jgi:hypothetical protein